MIDIDKCCGCNNCVNVCPQNCLKMELTNEGFWYPKIINDTCIKCGKCNKVCPVYLDLTSYCTSFGKDCFYGKHTNEEILVSCSSGGIATALSETIIYKSYGKVYGSAYSKDYSFVHTIKVENVYDLECLKGSKYVQSLKKDIFCDIKKELDRDTVVLYIGVPCEIAGLKAFLKKDYDNLLTIDLVCHGPTSVFAMRDYLAQFKDIKFFNMRYKKEKKWVPYFIRVDAYDGKEFSEKFWESNFGYIFNRFARKYCYECKFKGSYRFSDLTIGDAWGSPQNILDENEKGLSSIIVNSEKGEWLLKYADNIKLTSAELKDVIAGNPNLIDKRVFSKEWEIIAQNLNKVGLNKTVVLIKPLKKRILDYLHILKNKYR